MPVTSETWKVKDKRIFVYAPGWSCDGKVIADCNQWLGDEAEANAKLIAAAPDLYRALLEARHWISNRHQLVLEMVDRALAKAENTVR